MIQKIIVVLFLSMLIFSCKDEETKVSFLQKENVQLVQPRIIASNTVIDSFVTIRTDRNIDGAEVFYSSDGSDPTKKSLKLIKELKISEPSELKFRAFHHTYKASEVAVVKLYKKGYSASAIKWHTNSNEKYKGTGDITLINGQKATLEYSNPQWVGFDTIAKATVNFDKNIELKSIDIGYLNDPASWIFPPSEIEVIVNNKEKLSFQLEPLAEVTDRAMMDFTIPINQMVNTISISVKNVQQIPVWHDGNGNKAWLFMDEWIFN
ncbi:chitobiase/beta-hexosaminidase C-terminal domain-containing protein [Aureibaculum luteum]|uniref:chitobiase/beta-hexosaminidase C-terminal domain-containing protein n=1 Tax=Aureibaculum luteum TaxID=1548456 RepID=UPI00130028DC|nr:chitobiase/beta-hexosaminidase C-terminal domain-containing protein [Aureibaculum luteum]